MYIYIYIQYTINTEPIYNTYIYILIYNPQENNVIIK